MFVLNSYSTMRLYTFLILLLLGNSLLTQEILEHPTFPKGVNSNDQYEALPFYNEAVELYKNGEIELAKKSLHEAVNTSFALVEAQLFLGQIYYDQNKLDSAMIYLNSGIDFEINQPAYYYFLLFEVGMKFELYDVVKHNLKHFEKYYKHLDHGRYDSTHTFTVDDYEFYKNSIALATDHNYWKSSGEKISTVELDNNFEIQKDRKHIILSSEEKTKKLLRKPFLKKHNIRMTEEQSDIEIWVSNGILFKTDKTNNGYISYWKNADSQNWIELPKKINDGSWNGQFYFSSNYNLLYFTSTRNKNKDLFVVKFDPIQSIFGEVYPLERINTDKDEQFPVLENDVFYFSSNGLPGFGGFDLFFTPDYSIENGILVPSKWYNMGKPYNSGDDEIQIVLDGNHRFINSTSWREENYLLIYDFVKPEEPFDYEIKMSGNISNN